MALAVGLPLAVALQISVLILSLLALVPIPSLRRALSGMLLTLTGILGDSYVLVESDLQRAAIVNKTRDALVWLAETCEHVVVVAHSQGAAVAHHALRESPPSNVRLLLTFGSGLGKIEELLHTSVASARVTTARLAPLVFLLAALIGYITLYEGADHLSQFAVFFVGFMIFLAVVFVLLSVRGRWDTVDEWARDLRLNRETRPDLRWIDVYASHDPVPNGTLVPGAAGIDGLDSKRVVNLRSLVQDHTAYWRNRCEFVPCVVRNLGESARLHLFRPADVTALEEAAASHHRHARWLVATRWATWLSAIVLLWLFWGPLLEHGRLLRGMLEALDSRIGAVLKGLKTVAVFAFPFLGGERAADAGLRLLGGVIPLCLIVAWRYGYRFVWRWWDDLTIERLFGPSRQSGVVDRAVLDFVVVAAGFAPLLAVCALPFFRAFVIGHVLASAVLTLYLLMGLYVIGRFALISPGLLARAWGHAPAAWEQFKKELVGVAVISLTVGVVLVVAIPTLERIRDMVIYGFAVLITVPVLVRLHALLRARVRAMTQRVIAGHAAVFGPIIITLAAVSTLVAARRTLPPETGIDGIDEVLMVAVGAYLIALGISHAAAWLVGRLSQSRSHP